MESWICVVCGCIVTVVYTRALACVSQTEVGKMDYPVPDDVRKQLLENPVPVRSLLHYPAENMSCVLTSA